VRANEGGGAWMEVWLWCVLEGERELACVVRGEREMGIGVGWGMKRGGGVRLQRLPGSVCLCGSLDL
jgi:hypothetical protein